MPDGVNLPKHGDEKEEAMGRDQSVGQEAGGQEDWLALFDAYGVQYVALDRRADRELMELLRSEPRWRVDFEDGEAVLFVLSGVARGTGGRV